MKDPDRNLYSVKDLMGHTNIKTTLEYFEPDIKMIKQALDNRKVSPSLLMINQWRL